MELEIYNKKVELLQVKLSLLPQVEIPVTNYFEEGKYSREITIPKGTTIIGKRHRTKHNNILVKGHCLVAMDGNRFELKAPFEFISNVGCKKVISAIEDTVWKTEHLTDETDLDKLENLLIDTEYETKLKEDLLCHG